MKLKAFAAVAILAAGLSTSVALGDPGHGRHGGPNQGGPLGAATTSSTSTTTSTTTRDRPPHPPKQCALGFPLELAGTGSASGSSLALTVMHGGRGAKDLDGKQLTLDISQARVHGTASSGGKVQVHALACVDLVAGTVKLVAQDVHWGGPKPGGDDGNEHSTSTSTTTTTTTS
jgi:hypothetical protein